MKCINKNRYATEYNDGKYHKIKRRKATKTPPHPLPTFRYLVHNPPEPTTLQAPQYCPAKGWGRVHAWERGCATLECTRLREPARTPA